MTDKTIKHEIKLQKSVVVILGILAVGIFANAFAPAFSIKEAMAQNIPNLFGDAITINANVNIKDDKRKIPANEGW